MKGTPFKVLSFFALICFIGLACQLSPFSINQGPIQNTLSAAQTKITGLEQIVTEIPPVYLTPTGNAGTQSPITVKSDGFSLLGQTGGSTFAVAVKGKIAFIGQGPRVVTLDISHADSPSLLGESALLPGLVTGIALEGKYVYAAARYGGLHIIEISDPAHPALISSIQPEVPGCNAVFVESHTAYLACNPGGLWIVDISDPRNPKEISSGVLKGAAASLTKVGRYIYLSDVTAHGLDVFDISNPSHPQKAGFFDLASIPGSQSSSYMIYSIKSCGNYLCMALDINGLVILDLATPQAPAFVGRLNTPIATGLATDGDIVAVANDTDGIHLVDISSPDSPSEIGLLPTSVGGWELSVMEGQERGMIISDHTLFLTDPTHGLTIMDINHPASPTWIGQYITPLPNWLQEVRVVNDRAYVIGRYSGFRVVDVSDPSAPREIAFDSDRKNLNTQVPTSLIMRGTYAYISDANYPFHVYDISNPGKPVQVGAVFDRAASDGAYDMELLEDTVYLSGWGGKDAFYPGDGLWVLDIHNPAQPAAAGFVKIANQRWRLALGSGYLYALDGSVDNSRTEPISLRVFDLTDPRHPSQVTSIPIPELQPMMMSSLLVDGSHLYISTPLTGVLDYDISTPDKPVLHTILPITPPGSPEISINQSILIIGGQMAYDISDTERPEYVGTAGLPGAWSCAIVDNRVYIVTQFQGLYIYDFSPVKTK